MMMMIAVMKATLLILLLGCNDEEVIGAAW